jgi:hypothetical protein
MFIKNLFGNSQLALPKLLKSGTLIRRRAHGGQHTGLA